MKIGRAIERLKKKAAKLGFSKRTKRKLVLKAINAATNGEELINVVKQVRLHGEQENRLVLEKAKLFKMDAAGWSILCEKAEDGSRLREHADTMSYRLSPFYDPEDDEKLDDES